MPFLNLKLSDMLFLCITISDGTGVVCQIVGLLFMAFRSLQPIKGGRSLTRSFFLVNLLHKDVLNQTSQNT